MSEPFITFEEFSDNSRNTYRFFDDRIERDWKVIVRSGKEIYPISNITGRLAEQTTFAHGLKTTLQSLAVYLILGLVLHLGFDHRFLNRVGFVLYGLAGLSVVLALMKLKKDKWLYVKQKDGSTLFCIREKGLKGISRDQFVSAIQRYAERANQSPEPMRAKGPHGSS